MRHLIFAAVLLVLRAAPAYAWIQVTPAAVGSGPYYLDQPGETYVLTGDVLTPGTAFVFSAQNCTLDLGGHTVTFGGDTTKYRYGVAITPNYARWPLSDITRWTASAGAVVTNGNIVQGAGHADSCAAIIATSHDITVSGVSILISGNDTWAMKISESYNLSIYGNVISDSTRVVTNRYQGRAAIDLDATHDGQVEVHDNVIHACRQWGIRIHRRDPSTKWFHIYDNRIYPWTVNTNGYGIGIHGDRMEAYGNTISAYRGRGIHIEKCDSVLVHDNNITVQEEPVWPEYGRTSAHGIKLEHCSNTEVWNNTVLSLGRARFENAIGDGAALSFHVDANSNNYVHDNVFAAREVVSDPLYNPQDWGGMFATPVECLYAHDPSGLRLENNTFISNDLFLVISLWFGNNNADSTDASDVFWKNNTFEMDSTVAPTGRPKTFFTNSSFYNLTFTDCRFGSMVDFHDYSLGWPWSYCSWKTAYNGSIQVVDHSGLPVAGATVAAFDSAGNQMASNTTGPTGAAPFLLDDYAMAVKGYPTITQNVEHNPYTFRVSVPGGGDTTAVGVVDRAGFLIRVVAGATGSDPPPSPGPDFGFVFAAVGHCPISGAGNVPPEAGIRWNLNLPVDSTVVYAGMVTVTGSLSGPVAGHVSLQAGNRVVVFQPDRPYRASETVTARLSGLVRSTDFGYLDGNGDGTAQGDDGDANVITFTVAGDSASPGR